MAENEQKSKVDALVKELEDEMNQMKTFNAKKHMDLWRLDKEKAFEMFEKSMSDRSVKMVFDGL